MLWLSNALICIFLYFIFTWAYCTSGKRIRFLFVFTSATCKCTRFAFIFNIVFCKCSLYIWNVYSTRGVHLIKYLHIALANKPLQIYFQLTVIPKPRFLRLLMLSE